MSIRRRIYARVTPETYCTKWGGGFVPANASRLDRGLRVACVGDVSNLGGFLMPRWDYARGSYGQVCTLVSRVFPRTRTKMGRRVE